MNGKLPDKLAAARLMACNIRPYFASALYALRPVECKEIGTMAVDKHWRLYWAPNFIQKHDVAELAGVFLHEVEHLLRDHHLRIGSRKIGLWNRAGDFEINDGLVAQGVKLPEGALLPQNHGLKPDMLAEEYYQGLEETGISVPQLGDGPPMPGSGMSGSCADGKDRPWEIGESDSSGSGISKTEADIIRRRVAGAVNEAGSKSQGTIPGSLRRWAKSILKPQVDWRRELRAMLRIALGKVKGMSDYSYSRPSRRQSAFGNIIMPSMVDPVPHVAVVVDTSGSMTQGNLEQGLAEIKGVLMALANRDCVTVLSVDAKVHTCRKIFDTRQVELIGGGGTNMGSGIQVASELRPRPDVIIVFTDGITPWPSSPPLGSKVVICICGQGGTTPPWAKTVRVPDSEN